MFNRFSIIVFLFILGFGFIESHEYDFKSEQLIWTDDFDFLDETKWTILVSDYPKEDLGFYRQNLSNQYISDGVLHLDHTFTGLDYGEEFLYSGELDLYTLDPDHPCNQKFNKEENCKQSSGPDILPPVTANRMDTSGKFGFKYGRVEIKAKNMLGDWVRNALWMMPTDSVYGGWPRSGEIDIKESSGSRFLQCGENSRGVDWFQDTIHYGPSREDKTQFPIEHYDHENNFADYWHKFGIIWTETYLAFMLDGEETRRIAPPEGGMWELGGFEGDNIYEDGNIMAPFDQEFHFILSTAPGVTWPFSNCDPPMPWDPNSEDPGRQFWESRDDWISSFNQPFLIDYIKVYQDDYQRNRQ